MPSILAFPSTWLFFIVHQEEKIGKQKKDIKWDRNLGKAVILPEHQWNAPAVHHWVHGFPSTTIGGGNPKKLNKARGEKAGCVLLAAYLGWWQERKVLLFWSTVISAQVASAWERKTDTQLPHIHHQLLQMSEAAVAHTERQAEVGQKQGGWKEDVSDSWI